MTEYQRENASKSFKCSKCGTMFEIMDDSEQECPVCGNICSSVNCEKIEASNEGY